MTTEPQYRAWTRTEDDIVHRTYPTGGSIGTLRALTAAGGPQRTRRAILNRAITLGVPYRMTGKRWISDFTRTPLGWNGANARSRALAELAESNPTPAEYDERKRQILAGASPGAPRHATNGVIAPAAPQKPQASHNGVTIPPDEVKR